MDQKQLTDMITGVLKSLTPIKVIASLRDETTICVLVVSNAFDGKTFIQRFKEIDNEISTALPELHSKFIFKFEAFTKSEAETISNNENDRLFDYISFDKASAKELN